MKTLIFAAFLIVIVLAGCSVSQPVERDYYPSHPIYHTSPYAYYDNDTYYNQGYDNRYNQRLQNYNYYYDRRYNNGPVYVVPAYPSRNYRREYSERRDDYRDQPKQNNESRERRLPDGTKISPDGTVTLPNGEVRRRQ